MIIGTSVPHTGIGKKIILAILSEIGATCFSNVWSILSAKHCCAVKISANNENKNLLYINKFLTTSTEQAFNLYDLPYYNYSKNMLIW